MDEEKKEKGAVTGCEAWQRRVSDTFFPLDIDLEDEDRFSGKLDSWQLGVVGLSQMRCDGVLYRRHKRHFLSETDSSVLITIPKIGDVGFSQAKRQTTCSPGSFLVERGDSPYEFWHSKTNELFVLKIPSDSLRARVGSTDRLGALSFDATQGVAGYFLDVVKSTASVVDTLDERARNTIGKHILELLCLSIQGDERILDSNTSTIRAAHLHRAEQFIRNNLDNPDLSPGGVAAACNVSQRYLQKLFADVDRSILGFIREKRLTRCYEDLRSPNSSMTVAEIAFRWGFSDPSQFNKAYRARFGCTPTETRNMSPASQGPP